MVAVLEFISVRKTIAVTTTTKTRRIGIPSRSNVLPIQTTRPEDLNDEAIASPPPMSIAIPQGISLASFQSSKRSTSPLSFNLPLGILKSASAARKATVESLTKPFTPRIVDHCSRKIKPSAYSITMYKTFFSAEEILPRDAYSSLIIVELPFKSPLTSKNLIK